MKSGLTCAFAAAALVVSVCVPARPSVAQTIDAVDGAYQDWVAKHKVEKGVLAVTYRKRLVLNRGYGAGHADRPVHMASLSKAITAVCFANLVDAGALSFDTTIGDGLAAFFKKSGDPADARIKPRTVTDLLTHRLGYDKESDPTWGKVFADFIRRERTDLPNMDKLLANSMRIKMPHDPGGAYRYSNVHYLMLGVMIEEATGKPYESYCRETVLEPLGIAGARLNPVWAIRSAAGGWLMTGAQYLRFYEVFAPDSPHLGAKAKAFLADDTDKWITAKKDSYYTLGVMMRRTSTGTNVFHTGALEFTPSSTTNPALRADLGAYVYRLASGVSWIAHFDPKPGDAAINELGAALNRAIGTVKEWPADDLYAGIDKK